MVYLTWTKELVRTSKVRHSHPKMLLFNALSSLMRHSIIHHRVDLLKLELVFNRYVLSRSCCESEVTRNSSAAIVNEDV